MLKTNTKSKGPGNVTWTKFKNRIRTQVHTRCPISRSLVGLVVWIFFHIKKWFMSTLVENFNYFWGHALDFKTYRRKARKWKHFAYKFYILVILLFSRLHQRWRFLNIQMKGAWWSASTNLCICFHYCNRAFLKNRLTVVTCPGVPPSSSHQFH